MSFIRSLFLIAAGVGLASQAFPEPQGGLLAAAAVGIGVAGLVLWLRARRRPARRRIVVDGSNVLHWGGTPSMTTVANVVRQLRDHDLAPLVWFDANVGYLVWARYAGPAVLARQLRLPVSDVRVAPKGTPADPLLLREARSLCAAVVTNDRYRDWADQFPDIAEPGFFVRGTIENGRPVLSHKV